MSEVFDYAIDLNRKLQADIYALRAEINDLSSEVLRWRAMALCYSITHVRKTDGHDYCTCNVCDEVAEYLTMHRAAIAIDNAKEVNDAR